MKDLFNIPDIRAKQRRNATPPGVAIVQARENQAGRSQITHQNGGKLASDQRFARLAVFRRYHRPSVARKLCLADGELAVRSDIRIDHEDVILLRLHPRSDLRPPGDAPRSFEIRLNR